MKLSEDLKILNVPEIIIEKAQVIEKLCADQFNSPYMQLYSGANYECRYCGAFQVKEGRMEHDTSCPHRRYKFIIGDLT